ncbi:14689_t:CDS:2 [Cetraspora pellucida]|uniref:14689_t:CDS:1 n=1 Tax=Cetraspora pellucida TaxID=1433469 RepID=A0ACA9Q515_9GLOM|nr:14689_t:CDS:2 [Cetraspora pellucida]
MCNNQIEIAEDEANREYNEVAIPYTGTFPVQDVECNKETVISSTSTPNPHLQVQNFEGPSDLQD